MEQQLDCDKTNSPLKLARICFNPSWYSHTVQFFTFFRFAQKWFMAGKKPFHVDVNLLIISMTKLLDADWLRGVQLFH